MTNQVKIEDTFAEAFPMRGTRLIITAADAELASIAAGEFCGNASSGMPSSPGVGVPPAGGVLAALQSATKILKQTQSNGILKSATCMGTPQSPKNHNS